jgi:hypothetical protein
MEGQYCRLFFACQRKRGIGDRGERNCPPVQFWSEEKSERRPSKRKMRAVLTGSFFSLERRRENMLILLDA